MQLLLSVVFIVLLFFFFSLLLCCCVVLLSHSFLFAVLATGGEEVGLSERKDNSATLLLH